MASSERDRAEQRLEAALVERGRLGERFDAAVGTSSEFGAYVRLRAADDQVRAREAWLNWVDDQGYRGLNAGPFELLAESRAIKDRKGEGMTSTERDRTTTGPAQRRGATHRATGDRRVGQAVTPRRSPSPVRLSGAWISGRAVGGADHPRYVHLAGPGN
jgi:hypothetical protein